MTAAAPPSRPAVPRSAVRRPAGAGAQSDAPLQAPASLRFFVRGQPRGKGSPAILRRRGTGKPFVREKPSEKSWECAIRVLAMLERRRTGWSLLESGPVRVELEFVLPVSERARAADPCASSRAPDADKLARAVLDALSRSVYGDDRQVVELVVRKRLAAKGEHSGVMIQAGMVL